MAITCIPPGPVAGVADKLNALLKNGGPSYKLNLCPNTTYVLHAPLLFTAPYQEISTLGYPKGSTRAVLLVDGLRYTNGTGHSVAVTGQCGQCGGVKLRYVQINGNRGTTWPATIGGANIEMGGASFDQVVEYVKSYDPRGWSCLHILEGSLQCVGAKVRYNDIGPCGSQKFQQWSDGISFACRDGVVHDNIIKDPTDGGIVIFGSPGSQIYNNIISVEKSTSLGGINMVDYNPWNGNFTNVLVKNNTIMGGFASPPVKGKLGANPYDAIIKVGIAVGPRVWFGHEVTTVSIGTGAQIINNRFSGAFSYGMALSTATGFTIKGNTLFGNTSFIGKIGPNCSSLDIVPAEAPFVLDPTNTGGLVISDPYTEIPDGSALTCVQPPPGGSLWPYGGGPLKGSGTPIKRTLIVSSSGRSTARGTGVNKMLEPSVVDVLLLASVAILLCVWGTGRYRSRRTKTSM